MIDPDEMVKCYGMMEEAEALAKKEDESLKEAEKEVAELVEDLKKTEAEFLKLAEVLKKKRAVVDNKSRAIAEKRKEGHEKRAQGDKAIRITAETLAYIRKLKAISAEQPTRAVERKPEVKPPLLDVTLEAPKERTRLSGKKKARRTEDEAAPSMLKKIFNAIIGGNANAPANQE